MKKKVEDENLEICAICGKSIREGEEYHIDNTIGHESCFSKAISDYIGRRKVCIDDLVEQNHFNEIGQLIEVVSEHECEFYTDREG